MWVAGQKGYVTSYYSCGLQLYTKFFANDEVVQLMPVSAGILSLSSNRLNLHTRQVRSVLVGYNEGEMSATVLFLCLLHKDKDQDKFSNKDRPGSLFQPGPGPGPGSAKNAGTGILPGPGL